LTFGIYQGQGFPGHPDARMIALDARKGKIGLGNAIANKSKGLRQYSVRL